VNLGLLATHPIQYQAPTFRALAATPGVDLTVYFAHRPSAAEQGLGFGVPFIWDADLTSGYRAIFLPNVARRANTGRLAGRFADYDTPAIADIVHRGRFDAFLVHGWHARSYWQAIRACWATRTRVLVRGDSQLRDDGGLKRYIKRVAYPWFMRRFAACLSPGIRSDAYFRYYGARRVVRAPHAVDNARFAASAALERARRAGLRARWGIAPDAVVVLFAGKLIAPKRPGDVVRALAGIAGAHALFVGDGPLREACAGAARAAGVPTTFAGFLNQGEMPSAYAAADLLVLPSDRRETWGIVVNEAMASGLSVVVADAAGCAPDLVVEDVTGRTYPAGDVGALARHVRALVADARGRERMGAAAAAHVAGFSIERAVAGILEGAAP
jgi:glycosyltransferase involved in cell wall biosynthesis